MANKLLFIGEFPPPYTGVTIKDSLIVDEIFDGCEVELFDLYRFKNEKAKTPFLALKLFVAIKRAERICVGVGHPFRTCMIFRFARILHGESYLKHITVFMMGTGTPGYLKKHPRFIPDVAQANCIFTESETLNRQLAELGCNNARYLPNFRKGDRARKPRTVGDVVHFVYFAQVRPEKGIDTLVEAVLLLNREGFESEFDVSVYGNIIEGYEAEFDRLNAAVPNMEYKGAFDAANGDVYAELNQYDASSSSSSWREGMSGSNIECKFAGIANIVSDVGFNPECVRDGIEGLLVKPRDIAGLTDAMRSVIRDHSLLDSLKWGSYESRLEYDVQAWKGVVLKKVFED